VTHAGGTGPVEVPPETPERPDELYEDAPCGLLSLHPDGVVATANRTFLRWTGHDHAALVHTRFRDLLAPGDRIFYETHYAPLLQMQDEVREVAVTLVCPRGRLPVLLNAVLARAADGAPRSIRIAVFLALDRRSYETELLEARRRAEESQARAQQLARTLQDSLLPPGLPRVPGLDLGAVYRPAGRGDEVGGDFYDVFPTAPGDWAVVIGDVAGKGVEAATLTSLVRYTLRATAMHLRHPRAVLVALNDALLQQHAKRVCTVAFAHVRLVANGSANVTVCLGGHPRPLVMTRDNDPVPVGRFGTLLGALPSPELHETTSTLHPGDALLLYTDGVIEGRRDGSFFGERRLLALAGTLRGQDAATIADGVAAAAVEYQRGTPSDDIAVVVLRCGDSPKVDSAKADSCAGREWSPSTAP
jgi:sigma-B regulation protein RsbU (phosphoserine phosphatase)